MIRSFTLSGKFWVICKDMASEATETAVLGVCGQCEIATSPMYVALGMNAGTLELLYASTYTIQRWGLSIVVSTE